MPKPLLPVGGTPLIVWNLLLLRRHGIRDVVINLHYLAPMIQQALGDGSKYGMRISYSHERVLLGTGGALKQVEGSFNGEPILVLNGDTLVEIDLEAVIAFHRTRHAAATLVVRTDPDAASWGLVEMDDDQRIVRITGKGLPSPILAHPRMFAGVHLLHPRLLRDISKGQASSIIDAYLAAIQRGDAVLGFEHQGYWSDVGTPQRYSQAEHDATTGMIQLSSRLPTVQPVR